MNRLMIGVLVGMGVVVGASASMLAAKAMSTENTGDMAMRLGNFSVSLLVKDVPTSFAFYEKLGFRKVAGDPTKKWVVINNGGCLIGLHQGMIEKNTLTFNPGWDNLGQTLPDFDDVRDIQKKLKERGLTIHTAADEASTGPAFMMLLDPDGNPVLFDQHVAKPTK